MNLFRMASPLSIKNQFAVYDGTLTQYTHESSKTNTPMRFSVFTPKTVSESSPAHVLFYLSGML